MYSPSLKREVLEFYVKNGIKATVEKYGVAATVIYYWKKPTKSRVQSKWKAANQDKVLHSLRRKRHAFKVLACYANGNARKVLLRHKRYTEETFYRLTPKDVWKVAKKQKLLCAISGLKLDSQTISIDHILPLSKGGSNATSNIRLLHIQVNRSKLNYSDESFINLCRVIARRNR